MEKLENFDANGEVLIDVDFEDITDLQNDIDQQLDSIFQEFGGDDNDVEFKIHVKRVIPNKGETEHCFSCLPSELPVIERIKTEYGHGSYQIWIYRNGKIFRRRPVNIAEQLKPKVASGGNDINKMLSTLLDSQQAQSERYEKLLFASLGNNHPPPPPADPIAMMTGMMSAMVQMQQLTAGIEPKNPLGEMLENLAVLKEITDGNSGGGETNLLDLAKSFGPGLLEVTNKLADKANAPQTNPRTVASPGEDQENEMSIEEMKFRSQLALLVGKAAANSDPGLYAELILDSVPEEHIKGFLNQSDPIAYLASINPGVKEYDLWFTELINELKRVLFEEDENENENEIDKDNEILNTTNPEAEINK